MDEKRFKVLFNREYGKYVEEVRANTPFLFRWLFKIDKPSFFDGGDLAFQIISEKSGINKGCGNFIKEGEGKVNFDGYVCGEYGLCPKCLEMEGTDEG